MSATRPVSAASLRIIAAGAATGAVAGPGAVALYALLSGKALAAAALAKPAVGLPAAAGASRAAALKGLLDLFQPGERAIRIMVLNAPDKPTRRGLRPVACDGQIAVTLLPRLIPSP